MTTTIHELLNSPDKTKISRIVVQVVSAGFVEQITSRNGEQLAKQRVKLTDGTGEISMTLFNPPEPLQQGQTYLVENAYISTYNNRRELNLSRYPPKGKITQHAGGMPQPQPQAQVQPQVQTHFQQPFQASPASPATPAPTGMSEQQIRDMVAAAVVEQIQNVAGTLFVKLSEIVQELRMANEMHVPQSVFDFDDALATAVDLTQSSRADVLRSLATHIENSQDMISVKGAFDLIMADLEGDSSG